MDWSLAFAVLTVFVSTAVLWVGSDLLERGSARLGTHYNLPPVVQGGIIAAAGSSFPELATVVIAALLGTFGLGVGTVVGSAVFNILVIPGLAVIISGGHIASTRTLVHKETLFYILSVVVLFLTFALAVVYNPSSGGSVGEMDRLLVSFPLLVYGLYLFLQWQDTTDYTNEPEKLDITVWKEWLLLLAGLALILVAVERLVHAVQILGEAAGTPDFLWGVTVVAAATSVPDLLVSVQAAERDRPVVSISNVIGSNIFDLLVVIPVGVLITGTATVDFGLAAPMMGVLGVATVVLFVLLRTNLVLEPWEAYVLLGVYTLFVLWLALETLAVVNLLPEASA
jgi:cation:H+ antiporter